MIEDHSKRELRDLFYGMIADNPKLDPNERQAQRADIDLMLEHTRSMSEAIDRGFLIVGQDSRKMGANARKQTAELLTSRLEEGLKFGAKLLRRVDDETSSPLVAFMGFVLARAHMRRIVRLEAPKGFEAILEAVEITANTIAEAAPPGEFGPDDAQKLQAELDKMLRKTGIKFDVSIEPAPAPPKPEPEPEQAQASPEAEACADCGEEHMKLPPGGIMIMGLERSTLQLIQRGAVVRLEGSSQYFNRPVLISQVDSVDPSGVESIGDLLTPENVVSARWAAALLVKKTDMGKQSVLDFISQKEVTVIPDKNERLS